MGAKGSTLTTPADGRCEWCGFSTDDPKPSANNEYSTCRRCSGIVGRRKAAGSGGSGRRGLSSSPRSAGDEEKSGGDVGAVQLELKVLHLLPFAETLPQSDTAPTESQLLSQYLQPYFASRRGLYIQQGVRFQISEVDFKVVSCFPPAGVLSDRTQLRCMGQPLHALTELRKLHVLPSAATVTQPLQSSTLFYEYLKPFFNDPTGSAKAASSSSSLSSSSSSSSTYVPPGSSSTAASSSGQHHLSLGDTFMSRGVQFKVVACEPADGVVTAKCDIFPDGAPLPDVSRVHVLPIYESLPNNEKSIGAEQLLRRYLQPHFLGRFQVVARHDRLEIDGVTFRVQACEPEKGIVTSATEIYAEGDPLREEDLRRQQEVEDEQMARRLQQQEAAEQGVPMPMLGMGMQRPIMAMGGIGPGGMIVPGGLGRRAAGAPSFASAQELRDRMQQLYQQLPPDHHGRMFIASLIQTLGESQGAQRRDIDTLPTRVYHARPTPPAAGGGNEAEAKQKEENKEAFQCMVCLSEFENGDVLRTLPCFHSYHQPCIDEWLNRSRLCPLCKHPISES